MEERAFYEEKIRRSKRFRRILLYFFFGFIVVASAVTGQSDNVKSYVMVGYIVLWIIGAVIVRISKNREETKHNPERDELMAYLNEVAPMPEHKVEMSDGERRQYRNNAFINRIRSAFSYYEKRYGRPLTGNDKRRIEKVVGIVESNHIPSAGEQILGALHDTLHSISDSIENTIETIDEELTYHFGERARYFTRLDRAGLTGCSPEERLRYYNDMTHLIKEGRELDRASTAAESATLEQPLPDVPSEIDEEFLKTITEVEKFEEYVKIKRAKIIVLNEHDPVARDQQLKVFNHLVLRYREERGW